MSSKNSSTSSAHQVEREVQKTLEIDASALRLGMYLRALDIPWEQTSFLFQGFIVDDQSQIDEVQQLCHKVTVDIAQLTQVEREKLDTGSPPPAASERKKYTARDLQCRNPAELKETLSWANQTYSQATTNVTELFSSIKETGHIHTTEAEKTVEACADSVLHNREAMLWICHIRDVDDYTAQHSVGVAVIAMMIARKLEMSDRQVHQVGLAGIMHDVGKIKISNELLNSRKKLEKADYIELAKHTLYGQQMLKSSQELAAEVIDGVTYHHERWDGKGYPRRLSGEGIPLTARIIAVAEVYDAMVGQRPYREARSSSQALKYIFEHKGSQFDPDVAQALIDSMGIYPPGSVVEMSNHEVGVILSVNPADRLRPRLILVLDEQKTPRPPRVIDLRRVDTDPEGKPYAIKTVLPSGTFGVTPADLLMEGLLYEM